METLRAFIGLPLPEPYQEGLARLRRDLEAKAPTRLSFTKPGAWHVTLKFLGDIPVSGPGGPQELAEALAALDWEAFALRAGGGGFFPGPAGPRVLWTGLIQGGQELRALADRVEAALVDLGFPRERRPFAPHLTVARVRDPGRGRFPRRDREPASGLEAWRPVLAALDRREWPPCLADRLVLWQSVLSPGGPAYRPLGEFPAKKARDGS